jgi:hypothetical protein
MRDGERIKKNELVSDPQFPSGKYQRVLVEASCEQSTLALDVGLEHYKGRLDDNKGTLGVSNSRQANQLPVLFRLCN